MKIGDEVFIHGYVDEIRQDTVIIRNDGGYFGTVPSEVIQQEPKRGKLIAIDDTHDQCMECGAIFCITSSDEWKVNYCPNCGARMEENNE